MEDDPDFWNMSIDSGQATESPPKKEAKIAGICRINLSGTCALPLVLDMAKKTSKRVSQEAVKDSDHECMSLNGKLLPNGTYG